MLRYYITDRRMLGGAPALMRHLQRLGGAFDIVQVRENDLEGRELAELVRGVLRVALPEAIVLVNDRVDVALACGAHGVHLKSDAIDVRRVREIVPAGFRISVACHSAEDVRAASLQGADYALLSPIFEVPATGETPAKGPPLGLETLQEVAYASAIPVLALGGVTAARIPACQAAGAAGFAAIRYFQELF